MDKKLAFLSELKALLGKYDAEIGIHYSSNIEGVREGVMLTIYSITPEERIFYNCPLVKADDIMDYEKD